MLDAVLQHGSRRLGIIQTSDGDADVRPFEQIIDTLRRGARHPDQPCRPRVLPARLIIAHAAAWRSEMPMFGEPSLPHARSPLRAPDRHRRALLGRRPWGFSGPAILVPLTRELAA